MAKTVVFRDAEGYLAVLILADSHLDLDQVRGAIGLTDLYTAEDSELRLFFPYSEVDPMPPLGLPVYLDREVADQEFMAFNAGTHRI